MNMFSVGSLLIMTGALLAGPLVACGAQDKYLTPEKPVLYSDPQHPTPGWIRRLRSDPVEAQRDAFSRLSVSDRIEFAAYEIVGEHPPLFFWMTLIAREDKVDDVLPVLRSKIEAEPADSFVPALTRIVRQLSPRMSADDLARTEHVSRVRIAKISDFYLRFDAERTLDEIPAFVREYEDAHK
jgi:hypothetical protein